MIKVLFNFLYNIARLLLALCLVFVNVDIMIAETPFLFVSAIILSLINRDDLIEIMYINEPHKLMKRLIDIISDIEYTKDLSTN